MGRQSALFTFGQDRELEGQIVCSEADPYRMYRA